MRYLFISLLILFSFTACEDKKALDQEAQAKHDAQIAQQAREEVLAELAAKNIQIPKQKSQINALPKVSHDEIPPIANTIKSTPSDKKTEKLQKMGIYVEKDSITIDTKKTKIFFDDLSKKLNKHMKKISEDLEKGIIETKEAGIEINDRHIHIDLNKTENMLEAWGQKMQSFVKEFDEIAKNLDTNITGIKENNASN